MLPRTTTFPGVKYVFLDRDGVINRKLPEGQFVRSWREFELLEGVESAIAALNRSGRSVIIISNQRGIALGLSTRAEVETLHRKLQEHLATHNAHIDAFYYCPHDKNECDCRKPKTGLFEQAFKDFPEASAPNSIVVGDSISDIQAARNLGLSAIFIQGDPETRKRGIEEAIALADAVANTLADAVEKYLS
ncbi:MAG TPA: HAD family hydrolase [Candidatus Eremiobacteraceae bacterium]|nr:HAD family hydrolase [Candidatus Eremiobacteraceae bacterium]